MSDFAFFLLMLVGMLGYLALIGRVLSRRRGGRISYEPLVSGKSRPTFGPHR